MGPILSYYSDDLLQINWGFCGFVLKVTQWTLEHEVCLLWAKSICYKKHIILKEITLSRELLFSIFLSGKLFPESVLMRDPLESAFFTLLMFGVEVVYGEAKWELSQEESLGETEQSTDKH